MKPTYSDRLTTQRAGWKATQGGSVTDRERIDHLEQTLEQVTERFLGLLANLNGKMSQQAETNQLLQRQINHLKKEIKK